MDNQLNTFLSLELNSCSTSSVNTVLDTNEEQEPNTPKDLVG